MKEKKTAEAILEEVYSAQGTDELQLYVTLNPSIELIKEAMTLYAAQFEPVWVPCSVTPPVNGKIYNIVYNGVVQHIAYRFVKFEDDVFFECCHDESLTLEIKDVTHYMELPTPPTTKK